MVHAAVAVLDPAGRILLRQNDRTRVAPGSTVKPLVALAVLEARQTGPFPCPGPLTVAGRNFACSHPRTALPLDLPTALAYSCNNYFAAAAARLRAEHLAATLRRRGLEARAPGSPESQVLLALGSAGIACTALELAQAYRRLASFRLRPVGKGLQEAATSGTARLARPARRVDICGKTGTGRFALFAGWAPAANPRVILAAIVPGGRGGTEAAPVARDLFERFL